MRELAKLRESILKGKYYGKVVSFQMNDRRRISQTVMKTIVQRNISN